MVSVGQNWHLDCNKSLHSAAELVPGRSIDTVSFCGWAPCHAEAALCEYTSCNIPSSRMGNFFVMSSSSMASQSTLAFATKIGWKPSALMFHFWIRQVTCPAREPLAASFRSKMCHLGLPSEQEAAALSSWRGASCTSGRARLLIRYIPSLVCHRHACKAFESSIA